MSLRRSLYILLVIAVAGFSALTGALAGGAVVYRALQQGSANGPGLQVGDIITKIGDIAINETHSYVNALSEYKPGN